MDVSTPPAGRPAWPPFDRRRGTSAESLSVGQFYRTVQVVPDIARTIDGFQGGEPRRIEQLVNLGPDPGDRVRSDSAQRLPFRIREIDRDESAGVRVHEYLPGRA